MIAALALAAVLAPDTVLARYTAALAAFSEPAVVTFTYTLEQTGAKMLEQTHRVYRSAHDERDETMVVDGRRLEPPTVRIFRGRRDHYAVLALAPKPAAYTFTYVGPRRDARHIDYVFRLTPKVAGDFAETEVAIDGVKFLPSSIAFRTRSNEATGSVTFSRAGRWWIPATATAHATVNGEAASERLSFSDYRFPPSLPRSAFSERPIAAPKSEADAP